VHIKRVRTWKRKMQNFIVSAIKEIVQDNHEVIYLILCGKEDQKIISKGKKSKAEKKE